MKKLFSFFLFMSSVFAFAQNCNNLNLTWQSDIVSPCSSMVMTMMHDQANRPYLYVANKEAGLTIFNISDATSPVAVDTVPTSLFNGLEVMNLTQNGNYIYLAVGNHFVNPQQGGMAVVNVANPEDPFVTDFFIVPESASGAGIVKADGNYAYLGAMKSGLVILDVSDKNNIQYVSQFIPDINYPVADPNPDLYNARGMEIRNDTAYVCYDAGGLRIIDCSIKSNPEEIGRYVNHAYYKPFNLPRAYNNIVLDDSLAFIAVDYCGMEILNIKNPENISLTGWWNPQGCPGNNWFTSPVHTNEIHYDKSCKRIFISTGKSDFFAIDVTDHQQPETCGTYGGKNNNTGTWGVSSFQNKIFLSYICAVIPFASNWSGVKMLTFNPCSVTFSENITTDNFSVYPNPASSNVTFEFSGTVTKKYQLTIFNTIGRHVKMTDFKGSTLRVNTSNFVSGIYYYKISSANKNEVSASGKLFIQ